MGLTCRQCGNPLHDRSKFCPKCGARASGTGPLASPVAVTERDEEVTETFETDTEPVVPREFEAPRGKAIEIERADFGQRLGAFLFDLLLFLAKNKNRVIKREEILEKVWGYGYAGKTNIVDVYIRYLRSKIDEKVGKKYIHTVRGIGYAARD